MRLLLLCVALGAVTAHAQPTLDRLTPQQRAAYDGARLYLELRTTTRYGVVQYPNGVAVPTSNTSHGWHVYRGDEEIGEAEFYQLTGRDDLLALRRSRQSSGTAMLVGGLAAAIAGTGLAMFGMLRTTEVTEPPLFPGGSPETYEEMDLSYPLLIGGTIVAAGGAAIGQIGLNRIRRRATHAGRAAELVELHNARLIEALLAPPPADPSIFLDGAP